MPHKYSEATKKTSKGTMDEYLEKLEGACARTLDPSIKKGKADDPAVDRENQHVVHDKGLEKEKGKLEGTADKARNVPKNVVSAKPDSGRYMVDKIGNANYSVGSTLSLQFVGAYKGSKAIFKGIIVTIMSPPKTVKGVKYVQVTYAYDQYIQPEGKAQRVYFKKDDTKSFYVKIN